MDMTFQLRLALSKRFTETRKQKMDQEDRDIDEATTGWNFADWAYDKRQVHIVDVRTMNIKPITLHLMTSTGKNTMIKYQRIFQVLLCNQHPHLVQSQSISMLEHMYISIYLHLYHHMFRLYIIDATRIHSIYAIYIIGKCQDLTLDYISIQQVMSSHT